MQKVKRYFKGVLFGVMPTVVIYILGGIFTLLLNIMGGFAFIFGLMVMPFISTIPVLYFLYLIIILIIFYFKDKYSFAGIISYILILAVFIGYEENRADNIRNMKEKEIVNYIEENYGEKFDIVRTDNEMSDAESYQWKSQMVPRAIRDLILKNEGSSFLKSLDKFYIKIQKMGYLSLFSEKDEFYIKLKNKVNNNIELELYTDKKRVIEEIIEEEYGDKTILDSEFRKINKIFLKNGFKAENGMKKYKNKYFEINVYNSKITKDNSIENIEISYEIYIKNSKEEYEKLVKSLYSIVKEVFDTSEKNIELIFIITNSEKNESLYYGDVKIIKRIDMSDVTRVTGDIIEDEEDFRVLMLNQQHDDMLDEALTMSSEKKREIIEELFRKGINKRYKSKIEYAISYSLNEYLKELVKNGEELLPKSREDSFPLAMALDENNNEAVKILLEAGTPVNIKDGRREPVQIALDNYINYYSEENLNIFKDIVKRGADLNYVNKNNRESILARCKDKNLIEVIEYLKKYKCEEKRFDVMKYIIK